MLQLRWLFTILLATTVTVPASYAQDAASAAPKKPSEAAAGEAPTAPPTAPPPPQLPAYAQSVAGTLLKDAKTLPGLLTLHRKGESLLAEFAPGDYGSEYLILISISRGIAQGQLLGGMSLNFGDDWVWQFRKFEDKVHIVRKNVRFKANPGSPESTAVKFAYTDSVLFSLPIVGKGVKGGDVIDLTPVFMSDLPQLSQMLPGFGFSPQKSVWADVKAFEKNVELEVAATYASGGQMEIDTVPDSRGVTINVRYSITKIPQTGYQPRLADDRVGYFLTVQKDFSSKASNDQFVRFINRWDLQKTDPNLKLSPPKQPIVFWMEKTVPFQFRKTIREGIMEWNKAFEAAGFANAVEVRQQPDDADWDPEDVRYNTFRWITSSAGFAMGPSRVNPYTGQILDADIIFDADFLTFWKQEFETFSREAIAKQTGPLNVAELLKSTERVPFSRDPHYSCALNHGMAQQFAFGHAVLEAANANPKMIAENQEKLLMQGLKEVTMHEVGHTLGLRHNFKASKMLSLKDMNDPAKVGSNGTVASVMDYTPTNIVPKDQKQGDYYTTTVGPYDIWAIQYGYTVFPGGTQGEVGELKKLAARSGEPNLSYATDEDTRGGVDPDPDSNRFDLGGDALEYARSRAQLVKESIPGLVDRITKEGDDYTQARRAFGILLSQHGNSMYFVSRYVGGMQTSRSHKADKDAKPPFRLVDAKYQRDCLALLEEQVFSEKPFQFPTELYSYLASSNWSHWGMHGSLRKDYPLHDAILMWQERMLAQLLSPVTLERMHDNELKAAPDADVLTTAELIERLNKSIFAELENIKEGEFNNRKPAINSLRRNLQRSFLSAMCNLAMGNFQAPQDCQTIAYAELTSLDTRIKQLLARNAKLDSYTRAHLQESSSRIQKALDARLLLSNP
jgi:hypothetical protein